MNKLVTIVEIFKRKLTNFKHRIEICWEKSEDEDNNEKLPCVSVMIFNSPEFIKENENSLKSKFIFLSNEHLFLIVLKENDEKREDIIATNGLSNISKKDHISIKDQIEKKCIDNINEFFK